MHSTVQADCSPMVAGFRIKVRRCNQELPSNAAASAFELRLNSDCAARCRRQGCKRQVGMRRQKLASQAAGATFTSRGRVSASVS